MSADGGSPRTELKTPPGAPAAAEPTASATSTVRGRRRYIVMAAVPVLLLVVGGIVWLTGGGSVSTDNAYVQQDKVTITADVAGRIVEAAVRENQHVEAGDLLFRINSDPYRIALAGAEAALASARLQVEQLRAAYEQARASEQAAADDADFRQRILDRQKGLLAKGVAPQSTFDEAENDLHAAEQALSQAKQRTQSALAALGDSPTQPTDAHPLVLAALARRDQAALDLENTEVAAPSAGIVAQSDRLQVGQYVTAATPVLAIVRNGDSWIEANFKETDLGNIRVGARATITVDAYPGSSFTGEVASIGAGTGAEFALLPPQNATGNWVKVVQRVPVRVRFSAPPDAPLRTGMSASVSVATTPGGASAAAAGP